MRCDTVNNLFNFSVPFFLSTKNRIDSGNKKYKKGTVAKGNTPPMSKIPCQPI